MLKGKLFLFLAGTMLCCEAFADQITLKNGDRLTGAVQKSDGKTLTMKSDLAGAVTVPWDAVERISSNQPLYVSFKSGQVVVGVLALNEGRVEVETTEAGKVAMTKDLVVSLRSKDEQLSYQTEIDRLRNPGLLDLWSGFVDAGLSMARGNANITTFNTAMNAARTTPRDKIGAYVTSLYSKSRTGDISQITANAIRGGVSYNINLSERHFAFGFTDLEFDEFQKLDLRFVVGGGLGRHAIKSERTILDIFGGGALNKEFFSTGLKRSSGEILVGEEFSHKLSGSSALKEKLVFYPNLSETGEFRVTFDFGLVTNLSRRLGWHVTFSDRYLSNPVLGTKQNDLLLTTGIRLTFAR
jgi:putative salt-induced outer membrane protein YdiY